MKKLHKKTDDIRQFILDHVDAHPSDITKLTTQQFGITRQALNKHIQALVFEKILCVSGQTRNRVYKLATTLSWQKTYEIKDPLAEDLVWRNDIQPILGNLPRNVMEIWHYGFTEMFNNVIDHSVAETVVVDIEKTAKNIQIVISDNGVGIFKKIQTSLNLLDERHALFELAKGKLTTDPARHSGEGIFFTSRIVDSFNIISGEVHFSHEFIADEDWILDGLGSAGTSIIMKLDNQTNRTLKEIFDQYTTDDDYGFNKTVVPVKLALYGNDQLISRSQAKRLLARVELFKKVIFDFEDVESIGQAFTDEIFRVFANQNPNIELLTINTSQNVDQMISRAKLR